MQNPASNGESWMRSYESELIFFNLENGESFAPFGGPIESADGSFRETLTAWSDDNRYAIVHRTYTKRAECSVSTRNYPKTFVVDLARRHAIAVEWNDPQIVGRISWSRVADANGQFVILGQDESTDFEGVIARVEGTVFRGKIDRCSPREPEARRPAELYIRQGYSTLPEVRYRTPTIDRRVYNLNPALRSRTLTEGREIAWRDSFGRTWTGIIFIPAGARRPMPAIVQTHGIEPAHFYSSGPSTSAYPGRAALSLGLAVIAINENRDALTAGRQEAEQITDGYEHLLRSARSWGIDDDRVGVVGWSRTSYHVEHALISKPNLFKAAVVSDGIDYGYMQYLKALDDGWNSQHDYQRFYDMASPEEGMRWFAHTTAAHIDVLKTPVMIQANGRSSILSEWEFYAAARSANKPVEFVVFPKGAHSLVRPSEQRVSQQAALDWLSFWLLGKERSQANLTAQYRRWRALRAR